MQITHVPQARLRPLVYAQDGDVLTVNGVSYDFGALTEGGTLPQAAVTHDDWLLSDVTRTGGVVTLRAVAPVPHPEWAPKPAEGVIDWTQAQTASARAAARLAAWRAGAVATRADFATAALAAGYLTEDEAVGFATGSALPATAATALAGLPAQARAGGRIRVLASAAVHRADPLVEVMRQAWGLTDAQADALFPGAP